MRAEARGLLACVAIALGLSCGADSAGSGERIAVERDSPAVRGDALVEAVGIEAESGVFTAILEMGCALPCEDTVTFGTYEPGQTEILIFVFRGTTSGIETAVPLGIYEIAGFTISDTSNVDFAVTFRVDRDGIWLSAVDPSGGGLRLRRIEEHES